MLPARSPDAGIAGELKECDCLDAVNELAQHEHGGGHDDDAEQRHDRILDGHDGGKADQREEVAAERAVMSRFNTWCRGRPPVLSRAMNSELWRSEKKPMFCCSKRANSRR